MKRLGIDLGTSSIGWAVLDDERIASAPRGLYAPNVIDCGVVVFPEGMDRDKSGNLMSRAAERRMKRAARRLIRRRRYRKFHILKLLIENAMCPMSLESLKKWKETGKYPVDDNDFMDWLSATNTKNPYVDRKNAAERPVDAYSFGRAIYHIAQRRGFKNSKKELLAEFDADDQSSSKQKKETELGEVKRGIKELSQLMGERTLGQYFYELYQKGEKVRGRKTDRKAHYEKEFDVICDKQKALVSSELREKMRSVLFFQRPLRIQRHLVGWCELEKGKKYRRCLESHPSFERFRALCFLNNFKVRKEGAEGDFISLTQEQRDFILAKMMRVTPFKDGVKALMKEFNKEFSAKGEASWVSNHRDYADVPILEVTARFEKLGIPKTDWQTALNASVDFDDLLMLEAWAKKRWGFDDKKAREFVRINPSTERARYSLHAINLILPWLEEGYNLSQAIYLAKMPEVIPDWNSNKTKILEIIERETAAYHKQKDGFKFSKTAPNLVSLTERLKSAIHEFWISIDAAGALFESEYDKLYIDKTLTDIDNPVLPPVNMGSIKNPMVLHSLTMLRRLVNTLRANGTIDAHTVINIELARNVNSANMCRAIEKRNVELAKKREDAKSKLAELLKTNGMTVNIDDDLILRYLLWEEQEHFSVYTGQQISFKQMVQDCDIEHTLPRARGGTNEQSNMTLCESHYNRNVKKKRLPCECPNADNSWYDDDAKMEYPPLFSGKVLKDWESKLASLEKDCANNRGGRGGDPEAYARKRQKFLMYDLERAYWKKKIGMFRISAERAQETAFMPRQLVDTGSITKFAVEFLKQRYSKVYPRNGAAVAFARKAWGLQEPDEKKDRSDHTHHAMDAIVIAALDNKRFADICATLGNIEDDSQYICTPPYEDFGELAYKARENILVRHIPLNRKMVPYQESATRKNLRLATPVKRTDGSVICKVTSSGSTVRGSLHDDTLYGKINMRGKPVTVIRKTIASVGKLADLQKLAKEAVDPSVGKTLARQIDEYLAQGVDGDKIAATMPFWGPKDKDGTPDRNGMPLKKVRVVFGKNPDPIRGHDMCSGNSLHNSVYGSGGDLLELVITKDAKGKVVPRSISLKEGAEGVEVDKEALVIRPGMAVLFFEKTPEELYNLSQDSLSKRLYIVRKFEDSGRMTLRYHREARMATVLSKDLVAIKKNKDGQSSIDYKKPHELLLISPKTYINNALFEGRDFILSYDGKIQFLNR